MLKYIKKKKKTIKIVYMLKYIKKNYKNSIIYVKIYKLIIL